jgi:hypothetical protein
MTNPWHPRGPHDGPGGSPYPQASSAGPGAARDPHGSAAGQPVSPYPQAPPAAHSAQQQSYGNQYPPQAPSPDTRPGPAPYANARPPHTPDPTVIMARVERPRGLVISMSVMVTLGLVIGGILAISTLGGESPPGKVMVRVEPPAAEPRVVAVPVPGAAAEAPEPAEQAPGAGAAVTAPAQTEVRSTEPSSATTTGTATAAGQPADRALAEPAPARPAVDSAPATIKPSQTTAPRRPPVATASRQPESAWLALTVTPEDATVTVDGDTYRGSALQRIGPLEPGPYDVRVAAPGHEPVQRTVDIEAGETERLSVSLPPQARGPGKVRVRSTPAGATVLVDGKVRGISPLELELASGKTYELTLSQDGYEPWSTIVEPAAGKTRSVETRLTPVPGKPVAADKPVADKPAAEPTASATKERDIAVPANMVGNAGRGRTLFGRCRSCHGSSAPAVSPNVYTQKQWSRYFALRRHSRHAELRPLFSVSELADVKAFLLENAADVDQGMAAGVR